MVNPPVNHPPATTANRACYGDDQPARNLRIYQLMVESFVNAALAPLSGRLLLVR